MEQDIAYTRKQIMKYQIELEPLMRYRNWLEEKYGRKVSQIYKGDEMSARTISFPVYDGTLLAFVKEAAKTSLMDRNYSYVYVRHPMPTPADERKRIEEVSVKDLEILSGVLSKYVLGGMTKGNLWPVAVEEGIFLAILDKVQALADLWCQPTV